jgi:hypothetical protein
MNHPKYIFSAVLVALLTLTTAAMAQTQSPIFVSARNGFDKWLWKLGALYNIHLIATPNIDGRWEGFII